MTGSQGIEQGNAGITVTVAVSPVLAAELIAMRLTQEPDIAVTHTLSTSADLEAAAPTTRDDVLCVDPRLLSTSVTRFVRTVLPADDPPHLVVYSSSTSDVFLMDAIQAGCSAFASNSQGAADLVEAIHAAAAGLPHMNEELRARFTRQLDAMPSAPSSALTEREREVLGHIADGLSAREMSGVLGLSVNTVRHHTQSILTKLGVHSKMDAVTAATRLGVIPPRT